MRRSFHPPLSTTKAIKLSELEKIEKNKKKKKEAKKTPNKKTLNLRKENENEEKKLEKESITRLIQIYQGYYEQFERGLQEQSQLEALRLQIIGEINEIKRETAEIEEELPQSPSKGQNAFDFLTPKKRTSLFAKSSTNSSFNNDVIDFSPIIKV